MSFLTFLSLFLTVSCSFSNNCAIFSHAASAATLQLLNLLFCCVLFPFLFFSILLPKSGFIFYDPVSASNLPVVLFPAYRNVPQNKSKRTSLPWGSYFICVTQDYSALSHWPHDSSAVPRLPETSTTDASVSSKYFKFYVNILSAGVSHNSFFVLCKASTAHCETWEYHLIVCKTWKSHLLMCFLRRFPREHCFHCVRI